MKNIFEIKQNAQSEQGKAYQLELEEMNWTLQEKQFEIVKLEKAYQLKALKYKKFLGYDVADEDIEKLEKEVKENG